MKDSLILKFLTLMGTLIITLNLFFHIFGIEELISLGASNAVMTIYTSLSLICLYYARSVSSINFSYMAIFTSCLIQVVSLGLLMSDVKPSTLYFVSSSLPTSLFIITSSIFLFICKHKNLPDKLQHHLGLLLLTCSVTLLFAFITNNFSILGHEKGFAGVGVSVYTLTSFFLVSVMFLFNDVKIVSLASVNIKFSPVKAMLFLFGYSLVNFLLLFCPGKNLYLAGLVVQVSFLLIAYHFFIKPFIKYGNDYITICSWSNKIKTNDGEWINQEQHFSGLGISVNHGLSTEEFNKIYNEKCS